MSDLATDNVIQFGEQVLYLLENTRTSSTYKYAVLLGLMDLCISNQTKLEDDFVTLTTRQLAEKVLELYWPHTLPVDSEIECLTQNSGKSEAAILTAIAVFKDRNRARTLPYYRAHARFKNDVTYEGLIDDIEWRLIKMPLPKLQRLGTEMKPLIYTIDWNDNIKKSPVSTYQKGQGGSGFNNLIRFQGEAHNHLITLSGLLRPLIHRNWASMVARLNRKKIKSVKLEAYLFGSPRVSLASVSQEIRKLHADKCFYCGESLHKTHQIDHFIPWARYPDNGIGNLVAAHTKCNGSKSDFLASHRHVDNWIEHLVQTQDDRQELAFRRNWGEGIVETIGVATSIYTHLTESSMTWDGIGRWIPASPERLRSTLLSAEIDRNR